MVLIGVSLMAKVVIFFFFLPVGTGPSIWFVVAAAAIAVVAV